MRRFLDRLYAASGALAALSLASICVLMLAQAVGREFGLLIRVADDLTSWLCAAAAFLALGHTFRHGELVRVGLFIDRLPRGPRRAAELAALGLTAAFIGYMNWAAARFVYDSWQFKEVAQGLVQIPIWIPQLCFVIGAMIFLIAILDELVRVLSNRKPTYQLAEEDRRARGDYSEMA
ncbi:MAG: TRAP transporter small permease [Burkholderiales bacterium]|nr:TRAP transporter small permease [Burkholderiales bacterium]